MRRKSWLVMVAGVAALPSIPVRFAPAVELRAPGDFFSLFVDAVLLCFACVETICALELAHHSDVF